MRDNKRDEKKRERRGKEEEKARKMSRSEKRKGGREVCKLFLIHHKLSILYKNYIYILSQPTIRCIIT